MPIETEIRILRADESPVFHLLRLAAVTSDPKAYFWSRADEEGQSAESVHLRVYSEASPPEKFVTGAFRDGELIGTSAFFRESKEYLRHKGVLWGVYVLPEFRRQGIARALVTASIEQARAIHGLERINIEVSGEMQKAFYESLGFKSWGVEAACTKIGGEPVNWNHMTLVL